MLNNPKETQWSNSSNLRTICSPAIAPKNATKASAPPEEKANFKVSWGRWGRRPKAKAAEKESALRTSPRRRASTRKSIIETSYRRWLKKPMDSKISQKNKCLWLKKKLTSQDLWVPFQNTCGDSSQKANNLFARRTLFVITDFQELNHALALINFHFGVFVQSTQRLKKIFMKMLPNMQKLSGQEGWSQFFLCHGHIRINHPWSWSWEKNFLKQQRLTTYF